MRIAHRCLAGRAPSGQTETQSERYSGEPIADALRVAGVLPAEYEQWRNEYAGLLRTLGPLASPPPKVMKKLRRAGTDRPVRTVK